MKKIKLFPGYEISPVIKGGWQLSDGHSLTATIQKDNAIADTLTFIESGISTLDFGDIYTGVEELIGRAIHTLRDRYGSGARDMVQLHTKYVPNQASLENYDANGVEKIVDRSLFRLGVDRVDLVQLHWWKYEKLGALAALSELFRLKSAGKIRDVGVTNFDLEHLRQFVSAGFKPATIQVQYSVLDRRVEGEMARYCHDQGIGILAYGTVAGGLLAEKYLGKLEPIEDETRSATKYRLIIEEFGGWSLFQEVLLLLKSIAAENQSDIGTVASGYILQQIGVKAVIVGARSVSHLQSNLQIPEITFTAESIRDLSALFAKSKGPLGPVYDLERNSDKHRSIMHTNLG